MKYKECGGSWIRSTFEGNVFLKCPGMQIYIYAINVDSRFDKPGYSILELLYEV